MLERGVDRERLVVPGAVGAVAVHVQLAPRARSGELQEGVIVADVPAPGGSRGRLRRSTPVHRSRGFAALRRVVEAARVQEPVARTLQQGAP